MATKTLRSALFRDDDRLQKAAVDHKYHVQYGDVGIYVRRIQYFLYGCGCLQAMYQNELDKVGPMAAEDFWSGLQTEFDSLRYGISTMCAVLSYKEHYGIIGRGYQTSPDAIVGVMTIRHMDGVANAWPAASTEQREQIAANAPNSVKPAIMAGPTVGAGMIGRIA